MTDNEASYPVSSFIEHGRVQAQELLMHSKDITDFLDTLTSNLAQALSTDRHEVWCAVTLLHPQRPVTVASSSPQAEALDEVQYHDGDGPCLSAVRQGRVVHVSDTGTDSRWPAYGARAVEAGVFSVLAVPFELGAEAAAVLNVYACRAEAFDPAVLEVLHREMVEASTLVRLALRLAGHRDTTKDAPAPMPSRTTIDEAVGIIMERNQSTRQAALESLRAACDHRDLTLSQVAEVLVETLGAGPGSSAVDENFF